MYELCFAQVYKCKHLLDIPPRFPLSRRKIQLRRKNFESQYFICRIRNGHDTYCHEMRECISDNKNRTDEELDLSHARILFVE